MKKFIINNCMNYIKKNTNYDDIKLREIEYGLVGIYLVISKMIVIFTISILLGIFKEMLIFTIIYNIIRTPSFGLHATKSWVCLISSIIIFLGIPYICIYINIPILLKVIIGVVCIYLMYKNSPADTKKRPIVNRKRREIYKILSTLIAIIYSYIAVLTNNTFISNCLIFSLIIQNFMISPLIYRMFKLPYNNYIDFLKKHPDFTY